MSFIKLHVEKVLIAFKVLRVIKSDILQNFEQTQ